jgi:hypothetical protein
MKKIKWNIINVLVPVLAWLALLPSPAPAQNVGNKTVYQCPGGSCSEIARNSVES